MATGVGRGSPDSAQATDVISTPTLMVNSSDTINTSKCNSSTSRYSATVCKTLEILDEKAKHSESYKFTDIIEKVADFSDDEFVEFMIHFKISAHKIESILAKHCSPTRCVQIRRAYYRRQLDLLELHELKLEDTKPKNGLNCSDTHRQPSQRSSTLRKPLTTEFAYDRVIGACCENVIGCVRLPVGMVGPLKLDSGTYYVPLATTEGCLVASTSRGLSALAKSGGVVSTVTKNCMTRAPIVRFQDADIRDAIDSMNKAIEWLSNPTNKQTIKNAFQSSSKHTQLLDYTLHRNGRELHIRFQAQTGDAMGMNMCSKGAEIALKELQLHFPTMEILTLSGNMCTDKKPSAINWTYGRGKSVECEASLSAEVVEKVLKVSIDALIQVWIKKVMVGSAMAGSIGGFNCHAANIVSAIFIATGQDAAQVVSSSNCLLTLEKSSTGFLEVRCSMPSIECGTVGGGTILPDQNGYLELMGIKGSSVDKISNKTDLTHTDSNACQLARIICATVLAAELSLLASLTEGTLVRSHMTHNRSSAPCSVV